MFENTGGVSHETVQTMSMGLYGVFIFGCAVGFSAACLFFSYILGKWEDRNEKFNHLNKGGA